MNHLAQGGYDPFESPHYPHPVKVYHNNNSRSHRDAPYFLIFVVIGYHLCVHTISGWYVTKRYKWPMDRYGWYTSAPPTTKRLFLIR